MNEVLLTHASPEVQFLVKKSCHFWLKLNCFDEVKQRVLQLCKKCLSNYFEFLCWCLFKCLQNIVAKAIKMFLVNSDCLVPYTKCEFNLDMSNLAFNWGVVCLFPRIIGVKGKNSHIWLPRFFGDRFRLYLNQRRNLRKKLNGARPKSMLEKEIKFCREKDFFLKLSKLSMLESNMQIRLENAITKTHTVEKILGKKFAYRHEASLRQYLKRNP